MLEIILVKTLCLSRKGTCPEAITLFTGDLGAPNVFALPSSIAHLASPRQPKEGRCIKILPCKLGNLKEQINILYMNVVSAVIAPGVAVKGQGSCAHAARSEHCSGAPSHLPVLNAPDAPGFAECPLNSLSWDSLALQQQGYFLRKEFSVQKLIFGILLWDIIETICKIAVLCSYSFMQELEQQCGNETFQSQLIWIVSVIKTFQEGQRKILPEYFSW